MKVAAASIVLATLMSSAQAHASPPRAAATSSSAAIRRVEVKGPMVHARDVLGPSAPDVELGPTPPIGSSRVLSREAIERALTVANAPVPKGLPAAVRVSRKTRHLGAADVASAIRASLDAAPLPRGATLSNVRATAIEVPADFAQVRVDLPILPRRAGPTTVQATVTFLGADGAPLRKTNTPIDLVLPPEASFPEIPRGAPITLVIRRGLVEVSVSGVAAIDGDVGGVLPVTIKPSGRVLRARAIDKTHAVALGDS